MNVCLYGASSAQIDPAYIRQTELLGEELAKAGHRLIYGGGGAGLMGAAARGMKRGGGEVIGVVPSFLQVDGVLFEDCDEMIYTETMRQRKQIMEERSQAFIITPGGIGTYEEFFEMYTLKQLGRHHKPMVIFNVLGYYDGLLGVLRHTVEQGFMREQSLGLYTVADTPAQVLEQLSMQSEDADIRKMKYIQEK